MQVLNRNNRASTVASEIRRIKAYLSGSGIVLRVRNTRPLKVLDKLARDSVGGDVDDGTAIAAFSVAGHCIQ